MSAADQHELLRVAARLEGAMPPEQRRYEPLLRTLEAASALRPATVEGQRARRELLDLAIAYARSEGL
jgi:hypothetical protein